MQRLLPALFFLVMIVSEACSSGTESHPRTREFIDDSTLCAKYEVWFDTIYANLPSPAEVGKIVCPEGSFDDLTLFDEKHPLLFFEPEELNRDTSCLSYFRFSKLQDDVPNMNTYFNWDFDHTVQSTLSQQAFHIREFMGYPYFCVFYNNAEKYKEPILDSTAETFTPGKITGYAVIVGFATGKPLCAFKVTATNSESIEYQTLFANKNGGVDPVWQMAPRNGLLVDLWYNITIEVQNKLFESKTSQRAGLIEHDPIYK